MSTPQPTILELIDVAARAIRGSDKTVDFVRGSDYEALVGPAAIIWTRQGERDADLFDACNFHTATGRDLTNLAFLRYKKDRVLDTRGQGVAAISRPAAGIAETIWKGTTISIVGAAPKTYRVTADIPIGAEETTREIPIEALEIGKGSAVVLPGAGARFDDILVDYTWTVDSLRCADGTVFEEAAAFRERIVRERTADRVGQEDAIIAACQAAGALNVILFRSDYAGDAFDCGLNYCYVGTSGYTATPELVKACTLALRGFRVAGDHLQVLPMQKVSVDVTADIYLYDSPALFDLTRLERIHTASIQQYLNGASGRFAYTLEGFRTAIAVHTQEVQRVVIVAPTTEDTITSGSAKAFPEILNRYVPGRISLRYLSR